MTDDECLQIMGYMATQARLPTGRPRKTAAIQMGVSPGTLSRFERGLNEGNGVRPKMSTLRAIELAYGWRPGVLVEIWDNRRFLSPDDITEEMLLPKDNPVQARIQEAHHLTDEQLMAELQYRFLMRDRRV